MLRLFTALSLPEHIAAPLVAVQRGVDGARWSPRENLHITLCFYGDVDERRADALDEALAEIEAAPFTVSLKGAGFFGKSDPHALFAGVAENPSLRRLASACERAARQAGIKIETRKYIPHVTLAYLNHADLQSVIAFEQAHALLQGGEWSVDTFGLYSSHTRKSAPNLYRLEADYPL